MPPSKKSRDVKSPIQKQTLHNFFSATSATRVSSNTPAPKSRDSKATSAKRTIRSTVEQEIIVIDSDSDDDTVEFVETATIKKRRLNPKRSPDHNSSFGFSNAQTSSSSTISSEAKNNDFTVVCKGSTTGTNDDSTTINIQDTSFGSPILLVSAMPDKCSREKSSYFGNASLFSSSDSQSSVFRQSTLVSSPNEQSNYICLSENAAVEMESTVDVWENGDDEDVVEFVNDDCGLQEYATSNNGGNMNGSDRQFEESDNWDNDMGNDLFFREDMVQNATASSSKSSNLPLQLPEKLPPAFGPQELISCDGKKPQRTTTNNAFSVLMTSFKENEVWKEAAIVERMIQQKSKGGRRKAPFYKVLQGMPIAVDAFKYGAIPGVTAYFLTHAHSDHYTNLSSSWKHGPIYCSQGTANLIIHMLSVDRKWVHPLPMDTSTVIPNTGGVTVTLIEANHCPGSCLFFFEGRQTINAGDSTYKSSYVGASKVFRYLHCGDFRASPRHILHPTVRDKVIDHVYLDTTYLDPKYTFPPQPLVISACAELAKRLINAQTTEDQKSTMFQWMSSSDSKGKGKEMGKPLIVVGTYSIGKERIVKAIAHALNSKVYCDSRKAAILRCQGDSELDALLTSNPRDAMIHLVPLGTITSDHLNTYLNRFKGVYTNVIGFRPTGWTFVPAAGTNTLPTITSILAKGSSLRDFRHTDLKVSGQSTAKLQVYPVPYSEHSSFYELTCFAMSFNWVKMIATVNVGSESSRGKMKRWVDRWEAERNKRIKDTIVPYRHPDYW